MKEINIFGTERSVPHTKTKIGTRAVIMENGKLLLSHEEIGDYWMLPGGGMEDGETPEECCIREVAEETGYQAEPLREFLVINEYYGEYRYVCHCFICAVTGRGEQRLTEIERSRRMVAEWAPLSFFVETVSRYREYEGINEAKRSAYLREYTAITEYIKENESHV